MPSSVAALLCAAFSAWLIARDSKRSKSVSAALWIPVLWALIIASRPVSQWFGVVGADTGDGYPEDSLLDKALFVFLIAAGMVVLTRRQTNWHRVYAANKWIFIFFAYLGISVVWADDPFVALKRWVKDVGNIIMVLVMFSEIDPIEAVRTFFARCAYLIIPSSVLVIKYFPNISRSYDRWTFQAHYVGITTNKNVFGMALFICTLSLCWMFLDYWDAGGLRKDRTTGVLYLFLLVMTAWLLHIAQSSTALVCTVLGVGVIWGMRLPAVRAKAGRLGLYTGVAAFLIVILQVTGLWTWLTAEFAQLVGRDPSFHGRTAIWAALLKQDINPLLGSGYYSFWSVERAQNISRQYYYTLNEAHNGYLETYLNSGLIGLFLLIIVLVVAVKRIKGEVLTGSSYAALCLAFMVTATFYAISEAIFNRLSLLWFALLLVIMNRPQANVIVSAVNTLHGIDENQPESS